MRVLIARNLARAACDSPGRMSEIAKFISTKASDPAGAKALLQYLASPDAQAISKDAGYGPRS